MTRPDHEIFSDVGKLAVRIQQKYSAAKLIVVDGWMGAGKSTLAKDISNPLGIVNIDLDCFLEKGRGEYVNAIRFPELEQAIKTFTSRIIVSGACVLTVMEKLGLAPDLHVYVKRIGKNGHWCDDYFIDADSSELDEFRATSRHSQEDIALEDEVRKYHLERIPHERAQLIFYRIEGE